MERDPANHTAWRLVTLLLVAWQGWLTLSLFGGDEPWLRLLDAEPIVAGRHPLHLYHGTLGARSLRAGGGLCCYDPCFQAGYPKTPVFDSGSRPAELFLVAAAGTDPARAYKIGLAICCLLPPLLLTAAARGAGLSRAAAALAAALGVLVWWATPGRDALDAGDLDLLLAALAALAQVGLLLRFDRAPGVGAWLGVLATGLLAWFCHPPFAALLVPLTLVYYLTVGARHRWVWHLALAAALAGGVGGNALWLGDYVEHLWMHTPLEAGTALLSHRTFQTLWAAPLWGRPADRALALALVVAGLVGAVRLNRARQRAAARGLGLGALTFLTLALAGVAWEPLGRLGTGRLLVPALLFAAVPAAHGGAGLFAALGRPSRGVLLTACLVGGIVAAAWPQFAPWATRYGRSEPLALGLDADRRATVATVVERTTGAGRVLWEERSAAGRWSALLPLLTADAPDGRRQFLGGLDVDRALDHSHATLADGVLAGRPLARWGDADLNDFGDRYNVGWVACWSPAALTRLRSWPGAVESAPLPDGGALFALKRPLSFARRGKAVLLAADAEQIAFGSLEPDADGCVVLGFHYQAGMRAVPGRVRVEREIVADDPIPHVRLRLPSPLTRVTLLWER